MKRISLGFPVMGVKTTPIFTVNVVGSFDGRLRVKFNFITESRWTFRM